MPLDPYFAELHRTHVRDLVGQFRSGLVMRGRRGLARLGRREAREQARRASATDAARTARRSTSAWKRKNAQAWDTKLFGRVGWPVPDVDSEDRVIAVSGHPDVRVRIMRPKDAGDQPLPAVIAFFGGSFQLGGIDWTSIDALFRSRTVDADVVTIAVDYALAPENHFPAPVEQGYAALEWAHSHAAELGIDPERIAVGGISSGGNIAAAVTLLNRRRARVPLRLQILEVPALDLTGKHLDLAPLRALRLPYLYARHELVAVAVAYLSDRARAKDPLASPLRAKSLRGLPPAVILTAEFDVLRGDGEAYAHALRRNGVDASAVRYLGVPHDVMDYRGVSPISERWHRDVIAALRTLHDEA
ncbi:alpha/beta hydrolase [Paramicrobacterium sp. CJ85]|uniref:alpha/beta hydrolase n=1 Tax=Paramicrobacterium sp. CJ85 TaxID=3445355 RepID=UPI003F5DC731